MKDAEWPTLLERVAYHEAGHVLACLQFGYPLVSAQAKPRGPSDKNNGTTRFRPPPISRTTTEGLIGVAVAGEIAEYMAFGKRIPDDSPPTWKPPPDWPPHRLSCSLSNCVDPFQGNDDYRNFARVAGWLMVQIGRAATLNAIRAIELKMMSVLREHWSTVEALAEAMIDSPTHALTREDAERIRSEQRGAGNVTPSRP